VALKAVEIIVAALSQGLPYIVQLAIHHEEGTSMKNIDCPCGSGKSLADCCGPWHAGLALGKHAPTPEALMRSRYSAYVLSRVDYLTATWHPSTAPGDLELQPVKWLGLEVRHAQANGDVGVVEFVARCKVSGRAERMHELSRFVREHGRWYYIDGQVPQEN
jgi:SEC-C motif-containing protein